MKNLRCRSAYYERLIELESLRKTQSMKLMNKATLVPMELEIQSNLILENDSLKKEELKSNPNTKPKSLNEASVKSAFLSMGFLSIFVLSVAKSFSSFFFGENFKEIGLYLIKDDRLITNIGLVTGGVNFLVRFSMGKLYEKLGLKLLYLFNMAGEVMCALTLLFWGRSKLGFTLFTVIWRCSSGKGSLLTNQECTLLWGTSRVPKSGDPRWESD